MPVRVLNKLSILQKYISSIAVAISYLGVSWTMGSLVWFPYQKTQITPWKANVSSSQAMGARLDTANLYNSHLFGEYKAVVKPVVKPKPKGTPRSRLNILVVGLVTSTNPQKNLAVVTKGGKQVTYGINEIIEGTRAKLVQVQSDRIIVDNAGRNETVMLEGLKYSKSEPQVSVTQPIKANQLMASKYKLIQIRAEITNNPQQIFQYVRMSQLKSNGDVAGYRLSPGKSRELFDSVGLKEGDVATHLNGKDLRNAAAMGEIFNSLPNLTELNLTVERDGQPYDIYIEL